ncbi:hypothetical protein DFJ74DRAFT_374491 [Hyaloraphidium curvatum]|nr:hypothetical protein DFJ74DRAFT_374491 [Hyaloraphidium curvatum]
MRQRPRLPANSQSPTQPAMADEGSGDLELLRDLLADFPVLSAHVGVEPAGIRSSRGSADTDETLVEDASLENARPSHLATPPESPISLVASKAAVGGNLGVGERAAAIPPPNPETAEEPATPFPQPPTTPRNLRRVVAAAKPLRRQRAYTKEPESPPPPPSHVRTLADHFESLDGSVPIPDGVRPSEKRVMEEQEKFSDVTDRLDLFDPSRRAPPREPTPPPPEAEEEPWDPNERVRPPPIEYRSSSFSVRIVHRGSADLVPAPGSDAVA